MPALGTGFSDLGRIHYRNGVPLLSKHRTARIDGRIVAVVLDDWDGTKNDGKRAAAKLKDKLPKNLADYVWHHEEIVDVKVNNRGKIETRKGVRMVLVPWRLNSIPHSGPASWRRASLRALEKANKILEPIAKCARVLLVASFVIDPGEAFAAPFGGTTTMGDATYDGAVQRDIENRINILQRTRDAKEYRAQLIALRDKYRATKWQKDLVPAIDEQLKILDSAR